MMQMVTSEKVNDLGNLLRIMSGELNLMLSTF